MSHVPVLAAASLAGLAIRPDGVYVDATFGAGGHTGLILAALGPAGRVVAFDADPGAAAHAPDDPRLRLVHANFRALGSVLDELALPAVDGVLYDLGVSSMQFDEPERGFTFRTAAPLDMRLDPTQGETAADLLATREERELADLIFGFGEERAARRIARAIVARREQGRPVADAAELAALVASVTHVRGKRERIHPATRTFQALRIAVNDELGALEASLDAAIPRLAPGGRIAVISFHSLEDRIVKTRFRDDARLHRVTRKPVVASEDELARNPRARSAKLRIAERTEAAA